MSNFEENEEKIISNEEAILVELRAIREHLVPKQEPQETPKSKRKIKQFADDFLEFLKQYKVMGLAVAFIMAIYLGALVQALVDDIIMPILEYIPGLGSWANFAAGPFLIGHFVSTFVTFLLIALVIYILVKISKKVGLE
ncbi:MAG: MscL family protein [Candidatus Thorarchaeota archaeon]